MWCKIRSGGWQHEYETGIEGGSMGMRLVQSLFTDVMLLVLIINNLEFHSVSHS